MKQFMLYSILVSLTGVSAVSCADAKEDSVSQFEVPSDSQKTRFSVAVQEIMANEQGKFTEGGYIVYDAESDSIAVCTPQTFALYDALMRGIENGGGTITVQSTNPVGPGWICVGECKGNLASAMGLVNTLRKKIPSGKTFELHIEPQANGSYKVWYRIVTKKRKTL